MSQGQFLTQPIYSCRRILDKEPLTNTSRTEALSTEVRRNILLCVYTDIHKHTYINFRLGSVLRGCIMKAGMPLQWQDPSFSLHSSNE